MVPHYVVFHPRGQKSLIVKCKVFGVERWWMVLHYYRPA